nr:type II secretion system protein N [Lysobacter spongiae]
MPGVAGDADSQLAGFRVHGLRVDPTPGGTLGAAIIAGPDTSQQAYRVGDAIADGIVLAEVEPGYAVLRRGGREVRLALVAGPDAPSGTAGGRLPASPSSGGAPAVTPPAAEPVAMAPAQLMSQAGMRATLDGGYALVPRGDGAFFRQAGLEPGDVLVAVDGRPLDLERLRGLEAELGTRASTVLTVKRGDQTRTITLQATPP